MNTRVLTLILGSALALTLALLFNPAVAQAADRHVSPGGSDAANDCLSAATPCETIAHAVSVAVAADRIVLDANTFTAQNVVIDKELVVVGAGKTQTYVDAAPGFRHFIIRDDPAAGSPPQVRFKDLTLQNGDVANAATGVFENGGSILVEASNVFVSILHARLRGNTAVAGGAVAFTDGNASTMNVVHSGLKHNLATGLGGAVVCDGCGGIEVHESNLIGNLAGSDGGAIYLELSTLLVRGSTVADNNADNGGAIYDLQGEVTVKGTTLDNNYADSTSVGGGGAIFSTGTVYVTRTTLSHNTADLDGGALRISGGSLYTANSTFSGNDATLGGAINLQSGATAWIDNATFYGNSATFPGAAISNGGVYYLDNSIITASVGTDCGGAAADPGSLNNLVDSASCAAHAGFRLNPAPLIVGTDIDPTLQNNGGKTDTHALPAGSMAIDAGVSCDQAVTGTLLNGDQRYDGSNGYVRPIGPACDIGAFEYQ